MCGSCKSTIDKVISILSNFKIGIGKQVGGGLRKVELGIKILFHFGLFENQQVRKPKGNNKNLLA